uniref:Tetratricopeptide repeat protein 29 n=1 Tax=Heliothis virescens TaxID=7102 RepID=A0A2A4JAQ1_HELVI
MSSQTALPKKRALPKLMACMTKNSLDNFRSKALFTLAILDSNGIRRRKFPLYECLILELREAGYSDSSGYLQDLIYDNKQLVSQDDIGIVVDLRKRDDYLEHICDILQKAEKQRDKGNIKKECENILELALFYAEKEKGILWLAEKFFQLAIAVSSKYLVDGGRLKAVCKYNYGKFLLDKFPGADPEEPFMLLTEVRDSSIGRDWLLFEPKEEGEEAPPDTVFGSTALQLHRVLLNKARAVRKVDTPKAERLARLAERRAKDAGETGKTAEAIIEIGICQLMMNNLNNAQKTFERAFKIHERSQNVEGLCEARMHLAAVMQRLGEHETAAKLLTEMGASAMEHGLRRQLGRALHLLGELHLRRERPELGTQHLAEAFLCFMGFRFQALHSEDILGMGEMQDEDIGAIYVGPEKEIYEEEAEQSRLMTAISAGQELMASYFNLLREAGDCAVAKMKTIEWKLSHARWWVKRRHHDFLPCMCSVHKRTPLDVLWIQMECKQSQVHVSMFDFSNEALGRTSTIQDIRKLHSSFLRTLTNSPPHVNQ